MLLNTGIHPLHDIIVCVQLGDTINSGRRTWSRYTCTIAASNMTSISYAQMNIAARLLLQFIQEHTAYVVNDLTYFSFECCP